MPPRPPLSILCEVHPEYDVATVVFMMPMQSETTLLEISESFSPSEWRYCSRVSVLGNWLLEVVIRSSRRS